MLEPRPQPVAVVRSVRHARRIASWVAGTAAVFGTVTVMVLAVRSHVNLWGLLNLIVQALVALGMAVGIRLGALRARRGVRELPDPEALAALRSLADTGDDTTKRVARELMKGLRPQGSEVVPATSPGGSGSEVVPEADPSP